MNKDQMQQAEKILDEAQKLSHHIADYFASENADLRAAGIAIALIDSFQRKIWPEIYETNAKLIDLVVNGHEDEK